MKMVQQIENTNKETGIIKKSQMEILELKSTVTEVKISRKGLNIRYELAEVISKFEKGQ